MPWGAVPSCWMNTWKWTLWISTWGAPSTSSATSDPLSSNTSFSAPAILQCRKLLTKCQCNSCGGPCSEGAIAVSVLSLPRLFVVS